MASIREITRDEAATVAGILRRGFRDVAERLDLGIERCPSFPAHCQPDWIEREAAAGTRFFVIEEAGQPLGCVGIKIAGETCWGVRLAVVPEARHGGYGRQLMAFLQREARRLGFERIDIAVVAENTILCQWYARLGFEACGQQNGPGSAYTLQYMFRRAEAVARV